MDDPDRVMKGAGVTKKARWLTYQAGAVINEKLAASLVEEAARVAMIPRSILG